MREYLAAAAWWVQGFLAWVAGAAVLVMFSVVFTRFVLDPGYTWGHALAYRGLSGIVLGGVSGLGVAFRSRGRRSRSGVAALPPTQRHAALRASAGGAVPNDPEVRDAAKRQVEDLLSQLVDQRAVTMLVNVLVGVILAVLSIANHSLILLPVVALVLLVGVGGNERQIRQLRRRSARLTGPPPAPARTLLDGPT